jgi:Sel1 repeat
MGLSPQQLARAQAAQERALRMLRLARMNDRELRALLGGDAASAAPWVQCAAEFGLPAAQVRLGRMLLEGLGVVRDSALALRWFARAAEQRDAEASNMVGRCHEMGRGLTRASDEPARGMPRRGLGLPQGCRPGMSLVSPVGGRGILSRPIQLRECARRTGLHVTATEWFVRAAAGSATDEASRHSRSFVPNRAP